MLSSKAAAHVLEIQTGSRGETHLLNAQGSDDSSESPSGSPRCEFVPTTSVAPAITFDLGLAGDAAGTNQAQIRRALT